MILGKQKQIMILKQVIITFMAACTAIYFGGTFLAAMDDYLSRIFNLGTFMSNALISFFLFLFVSLSSWVLFSEFLPRNWILASLIGALLAGLLPSIRSILFVGKSPAMSFYLTFLDSIVLVGFIGTIPQWWLLNKNSVAKSYYWLLVNGIGWGIISLFSNLYLTLSNDLLGKTWWTIFFNLFPSVDLNRLLDILEICAFIPLGIGMGLFFTRNLMNKPKDNINTNKTESTSPVARHRPLAGVRAEKE